MGGRLIHGIDLYTGKYGNFFVCDLDKTACGHFAKTILLGDYCAIITSTSTNQCREFSVMTYVIVLNMYSVALVIFSTCINTGRWQNYHGRSS